MLKLVSIMTGCPHVCTIAEIVQPEVILRPLCTYTWLLLLSVSTPQEGAAFLKAFVST